MYIPEFACGFIAGFILGITIIFVIAVIASKK